MQKEKPFYWGVSASACQSEGAWNLDGKGPSIWDHFSRKKNKIANNDRPDDAAGFYHHYKSDLDLLSLLQIKNFRWSIAWSRIFPEGKGKINPKGMDFYDRLVDACLERNIEPWVTLYHWDLPQALEEMGGWTNRAILNWYSEYVSTVVHYLGDRVKHWMALNEPMVFTGAGYFLGIHAPGRKGTSNFLPAVHHAALAQSVGMRIIRQECPDALVGTTLSCSLVSPNDINEKDILAAQRADAILNRLFIEPLIGRGYPLKDLPFLEQIEKYILPQDEQRLHTIPDFIGIQNYTREVVAHSWMMPYIQAKIIDPRQRKVETTAMNWEVYPSALSSMIRKFNDYPEIPSIIVTENGAAFPDEIQNGEVNDQQRIDYFKRYLQELESTREEGCRVDGYFAWSFTDNFEWAEGYRPRFGLVHIDYASQKRTIKESARWYSAYIQNSMADKVLFENQL
jgi:beta-glucosidase